MMNIDVIIPVYRPTDKLRLLLERICKQTVKPEQVILLHTEDGIDLNDTLNQCKDVLVKEVMIRREEFDHGATRHLGVSLSEAEVVVFMTQDSLPTSKRMLEYLVRNIEKDEEVAVSYGRQMAEKEVGIIEQYTRRFNYPGESVVKGLEDRERLGIKTYFCSNVCAAYRREIYLQLGGFERNIIFNEDMVFAANVIKHGYKIAYEAEAIVIHSHDYSGMEQLRRNFDLGVSQACYPEIFEEIKSENEGIQLVKQTMLYLIKARKIYLIPDLIFKSGCKYLGFRLGKAYKKLPMRLIRRLTMNHMYWEKGV